MVKNNEFSMGELIQNFLDKSGKGMLFHERNVIKFWHEEFVGIISNTTKKIDIRNGVLYVSLDNASLKFELAGRKSEIIRKLNEKAGVNVVKDIIFT